jgi:hypothetical protein
VNVVVSPPTTATDLADERREAEIAAAVADQLKEARSAATGWQAGLAGLLTVITSIFFIEGKDSIEKLGGDWWGHSTKDWVTVALVLAALAAAVSSYSFLSAAHGNPKEVNLGTIRQDGLYVYNFKRAKHAAARIKEGQIALFAMLALVATAIVMTWRAPTASSEPAYQVTRPATGACGQLSEADNGQFRIVQDEGSEEIVPTTELNSLRLVASCP